MGCVVFVDFDEADSRISSYARAFGAKVGDVIELSVTHVVSTEKGTEGSVWAQQNEQFLVHPRWVTTCMFSGICNTGPFADPNLLHNPLCLSWASFEPSSNPYQ